MARDVEEAVLAIPLVSARAIVEKIALGIVPPRARGRDGRRGDGLILVHRIDKIARSLPSVNRTQAVAHGVVGEGLAGGGAPVVRGYYLADEIVLVVVNGAVGVGLIDTTPCLIISVVMARQDGSAEDAVLASEVLDGTELTGLVVGLGGAGAVLVHCPSFTS